jgi:hypothetical protein
VTICHRLKLVAPDGELRETDCANTEGIFRIIQSIPSPKAEPFKRWLAKVGYERVQEIEDPELPGRGVQFVPALESWAGIMRFQKDGYNLYSPLRFCAQ